MPRHVKNYAKNIACLESLWDDDIEDQPLSMVSILELIANLYDIRFHRLSCNTSAELHYNLSLLGRKRGHGILYLAFHGAPGEIYLHDSSVIDLETLADGMKQKFAGWIVHFGSCSTIDVDRQRLAGFVEKTGVAMIIGYKQSVDWDESAALDLLLFSQLQQYVDMHAFWKRCCDRYGDLIETTGCDVYIG